MAKTIENLFFYLHYGFTVLVLLFFIINFSKTAKHKELIAVAAYSLLDLLLNLFNAYFSSKWYNYIWSSFTLFEYTIFSFIIWTNIDRKGIKIGILTLSIGFIIFTTIFNIATKFLKIDSIPIAVEVILILTYCFYYLFEQMNDTSNLFVYNKFQFWIVTGIMIYLAGSFFVYLLASHQESIVNQFWFLTNCFYVLMDILFIAGILVSLKKSKSQVSELARPSLIM